MCLDCVPSKRVSRCETTTYSLVEITLLNQGLALVEDNQQNFDAFRRCSYRVNIKVI